MRRGSSSLSFLINRLFDELDSPRFKVDDAVEQTFGLISKLSPKAYSELKQEIRFLVKEAKLSLGRNLDKKRISCIIVGIAYWRYMIQAFAMRLAYDDGFRQNVWDSLEILTGFGKDDIFSLEEKWSETQRRNTGDES